MLWAHQEVLASATNLYPKSITPKIVSKTGCPRVWQSFGPVVPLKLPFLQHLPAVAMALSVAPGPHRVPPLAHAASSGSGSRPAQSRAPRQLPLGISAAGYGCWNLNPNFGYWWISIYIYIHTIYIYIHLWIWWMPDGTVFVVIWKTRSGDSNPQQRNRNLPSDPPSVPGCWASVASVSAVRWGAALQGATLAIFRWFWNPNRMNLRKLSICATIYTRLSWLCFHKMNRSFLLAASSRTATRTPRLACKWNGTACVKCLQAIAS